MIELPDIHLLNPRFPASFEWGVFRYRSRIARKTCVHNAISKLYSGRLESLADRKSSLTTSLPRDQAAFDHVLQLLETHLTAQPVPNILHVGCGTGRFCELLAARDYRTFGIDRSHFVLERARSKAPDCEFERASEYEPYHVLFMQQFDAIVFLDAIEHIEYPQKFIRQVAESLVPGGLFVVSARYQGYLLNLTRAFTECSEKPRFFHPLDGSEEMDSPVTLKQLLEDSGLDIVESQGAASLPSQWRAQLFVARKPL